MSDELTVDVSGAGKMESADVEELRQSYMTQHEQAKREHEATLGKEQQGLEELASRYESEGRAATEKVGLNVEEMRAEFEQLFEGKDRDAIQKQFEQVRAKYAPVLAQAIDVMAIDREAARREFTEVVGELPYAHQGPTRLDDFEGLIGTSPGSVHADVPPPAPAPQYTQTTLRAPFVLRATSGGWNALADAATGAVSSDNETWVGVAQQLAAVGSPFSAASNVRRVRVETTINVPHFFTLVGAMFGYASAEVIVNLKVLNGSSLVSSNRLSLSRTIAVFYWICSNSGGGSFPLSCEFSHSYGTPRSYAAMVELETWAGGAGAVLISPATAIANAASGPIVATLIT